MMKYILRCLTWFSPVIIFAFVINVTLILALQNIKYIFEPNLIDTKEFFLIAEVYNMIYTLYWVSIISFVLIIAAVAFLSIRKINKLKSLVK